MYDFYLSWKYGESLKPYMFSRENGDHGKITCFYADEKQLDKWLYQNGAEPTGNYIPGALIDNYVVGTPRGYAFIYEHFLNSWSSDYAVYFQAGSAPDLWPHWYAMENEYINEWGEIG